MLFVDFDNIFIRLSEHDEDVARQFATTPDRWVTWLESQMPCGHVNPQVKGRNLLVRLCYLNPRTFGDYRPHFIRSAFQVIDCPQLTKQGKTSADIHMVLDILDLLEQPVSYEEFIIFSGDADFTPVLLRLRRHDKRTAILAVGFASPAYRAACDYLIDQEVFMEEAIGWSPTGEPVPSVHSTSRQTELLGAISEDVMATVKASKAPVPMGALAQHIRRRFEAEIGDSEWLGFRTFKTLLLELDIEGLQLSQAMPGYVYDPKTHSPPDAPVQTDAFLKKHPDLAPLAKRISQVTDTPYLMPKHYSSLLKAIADEINSNGYRLNRVSKAVRDRCRELELPANRQQITFVLRGIYFAGHRFGEKTEDVPTLAKCLTSNTVNLCNAAQLNLTEKQARMVARWIGGGQ